ncbi:calcium-binding protein [Shimia thalassica]|uniref:calcium-binding protein n=1 Tax=Shimia thalassica TaxID=1715693 RepID=UPI0026E1F528|nr:calcium-binding protein [Shimia thalassica]MDO6478802.1 calcium-binding protein [Shimia thalassica]
MATITGTEGNDNGIDNPVLMGTEDDDVISGRSGNDSLVGLGGDDFLATGFGVNTVEGGLGNDRILISDSSPNTAHSILDGGDGIDRLVLDVDTNFLIGIENSTIRDIEVFDLREGTLVLRPEQLDDVTQIVGFGADGELRLAAASNVDLGDITVGEYNNAIGRITTSNGISGDLTIDASGATASWQIMSTSGVDLLVGGEGNDTITGNLGGDTLQGGAGDDSLSLYRGGGHEAYPWTILDGGDGWDNFTGEFYGRDYSRITFQNIEVFNGSGYMSRANMASFQEFQNVYQLRMTTPGSIDLTGVVTSTYRTRPTGADYFIFVGSASHDEITKTDTLNSVELFPGSGNDTVVTGATNDLINDARDYIASQSGGNDSLNSGDGRDTVLGGNGDDVIITWATEADVNDTAEGGSGNDYIETGAGNDLAFGDTGVRTGTPSVGDTIDGGMGSDRINGSGGNDLLIGGPDEGDHADTINGNDGNDSIIAGAGNDSVGGGAGDDTIVGGTGSDTLTGNGGDDLISGGSIADLIFGGSGADFINGGFGNDLLNGGEGADRFFHAGVEGHGSDWIQDFSEEDALVAVDSARASDFQVNFSTTDGAGDAGVDEAFVIYRPSGQILWALVDGGDLTSLTLRIEEVDYDLLI